MKKVYLVNLSFGLAGIERRFANLFKILKSRGNVSPILVVPLSLAMKLRDANLLDVEKEDVIIIPESKFFIWLWDYRIPQIIKIPLSIIRNRIIALGGYRKFWRQIEHDPEAIIHIGQKCSGLRPPPIPTVYECVDSELVSFGSRHFKRASKKRCIIHCQTERIQSALDAHFEGQTTNWHTITSPTYFAHYNNSVQLINRDHRKIAFVGRFASVKNPLLFIEAIFRARQRGCDCHAIMMGEGPLEANAKALIDHYKLGQHISICFHQKPMDVLRSASIYVSLQTGDNYGSQSLLEAMGAGCAIIASDVGETRRIITDDIGIKVQLTAESVSEAIENLIGSPECTRQMGICAEKTAKTKYTADVYASFLESVYESAVKLHQEGS